MFIQANKKNKNKTIPQTPKKKTENRKTSVVQ